MPPALEDITSEGTSGDESDTNSMCTEDRSLESVSMSDDSFGSIHCPSPTITIAKTLAKYVIQIRY